MIIDSAYDIDWFAQDIAGNVIHFASGGGQIPKFVKKADIDSLTSFFHQLPDRSIDVEYPVDLAEYLNLSDKEIQSYIVDFKKMSQRGLYSFDKSILNNNVDNGYHMVCAPKSRLVVDEIPISLRNQLLRLDFSIEGLRKIDISNFL